MWATIKAAILSCYQYILSLFAHHHLVLRVMRAYYYDNLPGDQRLEHDSGRPVDLDHLRKLGVLLWHVPIDDSGVWEADVDKIAEEQGCKSRDIMDVTKEGLGDQFDTMLEKYFAE